MKLSSVLAKIQGPSEKTASAAQAPTVEKSGATTERLKAALAEATATPAVETQKQAAATPIAGVVKLAAEVVGAEHEALIKEANLYGSAVCDGFMAQMARYDAAAEKVASASVTKVAAVGDSFEKFASENPELVKDAAQVGFERTQLQMQKLAETAYTTGYERGVQAIYKTASDTFTKGFEDGARLIQELRA